jgi:hypothetical protein
VAAAEHFVVLFGNSHFEAAIDPARLARDLSNQPGEVAARAFVGGGWDVLHYYTLALLAQHVLRPGRDVAVIEVCPLSLDDSREHNRLGVIRPEASWAVASLPGAPAELRLDVLLGAVAGLYRYRLSLQAGVVLPFLERAATRAGTVLGQIALVGAPQRAPAFELITTPGRDFVIQEVRGDRGAFAVRNRAALERDLAALRLGDYKLAALERAIAELRGRGVEVFLVETPTSRWYSARLAQTEAYGRYRAEMPRLAARQGAHLVDHWSDAFTSEDGFWDDTHMMAGSTAAFTDALARRMREAQAAAAPRLSTKAGR